MRLATHASAVHVVERVQSLWGGYGELWRVELGGRQPSPAIVKVVEPPPADGSRSHRRKLRSYDVEMAFYTRYAGRCGGDCRVPKPINLSKRSGGWLFVLEDLDEAGFSRRAQALAPADIDGTLRWLAEFHAAFLGSEPEGLWKVGTYWHLATRPDELARTRHAALRRAAISIDARLNAAQYQTLVHGDAKPENVCLAAGEGRVALVDFQYVGGGVGVKDVAYLLGSCLAPSEQATLVPRYLATYFSELRRALEPTLPAEQIAALESEWRDLFPCAWLDLYRFLSGWAPGMYDPDPYSETLLATFLG